MDPEREIIEGEEREKRKTHREGVERVRGAEGQRDREKQTHVHMCTHACTCTHAHTRLHTGRAGLGSRRGEASEGSRK